MLNLNIRAVGCFSVNFTIHSRVYRQERDFPKGQSLADQMTTNDAYLKSTRVGRNSCSSHMNRTGRAYLTPEPLIFSRSRGYLGSCSFLTFV